MDEISKIFDNYIKKGKVNHSYLIETNIKDRNSIADRLIDNIIDKCEIDKKRSDLEKDGDLLYLKTDNQVIKKDEILAIKEEFKTTSINNGIRIYVILETEKLNASSANTLLKFLEEPNENIYAILVTDNINKVITTIVSRCQTLKIKSDDWLFEKDKDYLDTIFNLVDMIESKKEKTLAYINNTIPKEYIERDKIYEMFTDILYIYDIILHQNFNKKVNNNDYEKIINRIASNCDYNDINKRMLKIDENIKRLKSNTNLKLSIYNFIIELSGVDINV